MSETNELSLAFGLSYASWVAIPRCIMGAMPPDWQRRMAAPQQPIMVDLFCGGGGAA